ncbi:MAG: hypothetical protein J6M34_02405 [Clostridia bacterium]|nr:hypothetical protein [Clostridia bacterium]
MLFSEKMSQVPQPDRADLWREYRTLCTALALNVKLRKEAREATEAELSPLQEAARKANELLARHGMAPSFFPEKSDFLHLLTEELQRIMEQPSNRD